jgi:hypothetical protein
VRWLGVVTDLEAAKVRVKELAEWAIQERLSSSLPIDASEQEIVARANARLKSLKQALQSVIPSL